MVITKISPQKKKGRFNIYVDGKYSFSLSEDEFLEQQIKVGTVFDEKELQILKFKGKFGLYFTKALNFLSYRPRSKKEVKTKLKEISYKDTEKFEEEGKQEALVESVLEKLERIKLINDLEFANWYIQGRLNSKKPMGKKRIGLELIKKGIDKETIDEFLTKNKAINEQELAMTAAQKKLRSLKNYSPQDTKRKLISYLATRGFGWDTISSVIDTTLNSQ